VTIDAESGSMLTLCVDTSDQPRRALWAAFEVKTGRTHRWGALVASGAHVRACPLGDITPYRRPEPIRYEQRQIAGAPRGFYETVAIDVEDPNYTPPSDGRSLIPGRMLTR
jgi:hypothetical protein